MATDLGVKVVTEGKYYFISYNTEDAELVSRYLKNMVSKGLPVWYDNGIIPGERWEEVIAEKIYDCEAVIMFLSSKIFNKTNSFVQKEWSIAKRRNKKVFLVILDHIDESNIPARYAFWWSDISSTQAIPAYLIDVDICVDKMFYALGYEKELRDTQNAFFSKTNSITNYEKQKSDDNSNFVKNNDFVIEFGTLKEYRGKGSVVIIPYGVTKIGNGAFMCCTSLTEIVIPDTVTSIGDHAFSACWSLTQITIPDSVTSIGSHAFFECRSITDIVIPCGVSSIDDYAFFGCSSLTNIEIPDSVTNIGEDAFFCCSSLNEIVIPNSVTSIGKGAFDNCKNLKAVRYRGTKTEWSKVKKFRGLIPIGCDIYFGK